MRQKTYLLLSAVIFSVVSIFHLLRLFLKWNAVIDRWTVPLWMSVIGSVVAGLLAYSGFKLIKK